MAIRRALVIGNDDYPISPLEGCINDAIGIGSVLETHADGSPNFEVKQLTNATNAEIHSAVEDLFSDNADMALLYFSGHGFLNEATNSGYLIGIDGKHGGWGMSLSDILTLANNSDRRIKSRVILLDCCHAGALGEIPALGNNGVSPIGDGVTILTACHKRQLAMEENGQGVFTELAIDALRGSASDVCGRITPASVYAHIDQSLGAWAQRPIYKANVQTFVVLREVAPKVRIEILRNLPTYFPEPSSVFNLDPSYEYTSESPIEENVRIFKELQKCDRAALVVPVEAEFMYDAAMNSTGCKLTALGAHYRRLAANRRI